MGASVFVCARGGTIVTCAATTGLHARVRQPLPLDEPEALQGCHFANYREAYEANRLVCEGKVHPVLSAVFAFEDAAEAVAQVHANAHEGKLGVLVLAPEEGLGVTDPERTRRAARPHHAVPPRSLTAAAALLVARRLARTRGRA